MREFILPVRVYYEDTDSGGVVYHANYLKFMERARTEWFRGLGIQQDRLARDPGVIFAVRTARVEFIKPAKFNQLLQVSVTVEKIAPASVLFYQKIETDVAGKDLLLCECWVKVACLTADSLRPVRLPDTVKREIMGEC